MRAATVEERRAVEAAHSGRQFVLEPARSFELALGTSPPAADSILLVSQAFVDFSDQGRDDRWTGREHYGVAVSAKEDATLELLALADETFGDLIEILAEMRIGELGLSRWELLSAPRHIELDANLASQLKPLRRG